MTRCLALQTFILTALLLSGGCTTISRRLEVGPVKRIVPGETTIAEVEKRFGRPHERVTDSKGLTVARYYFRATRLNHHVDPNERRDHPSDITFRTLTLLYGPGPVIRRKLHDESVTPVYRYNDSLVAGPSVLPENLLFLRKGSTTKAELIDRLGEPTSRSFESSGAEVLVWLSAKARQDLWSSQEVRRLMVLLDEGLVVKDYAVVETDLEAFR